MYNIFYILQVKFHLELIGVLEHNTFFFYFFVIFISSIPNTCYLDYIEILIIIYIPTGNGFQSIIVTKNLIRMYIFW